ncbi:MAG: PRC-barrel domain-containing protein [Methanobacterium sp.]|nr:PRC-barrel domain-containing protein [Methanobacterium sp.]
MKASEFIGMKVLDKETNEVGKIAEISLKLKKCLVENIYVSTGGALNKKYFTILNEDIAEIGDYVLLKLSKIGVEGKILSDKIEEVALPESLFKDIVGKVVIAQKGMEVGQIEDMFIDPKGCLIHNVIISTGGTFNKKRLMISDEDIQDIGDYIILKLTKEEVEIKIQDTEE